MEFLKAIQSAFSALIGIQKQDRLLEDFSKKSALPFIVAGLVMVLVFVLSVYGIVQLVLP